MLQIWWFLIHRDIADVVFLIHVVGILQMLCFLYM